MGKIIYNIFVPFVLLGVVFETLFYLGIGLGIFICGWEKSKIKGAYMEYISALALVVSVVKVTLMWLNYRDCKKSKKNTD